MDEINAESVQTEEPVAEGGFSPQRALQDGITINFKIAPEQVEWGIRKPREFNDWLLSKLQSARIALMQHFDDWHAFAKKKYEQEQEEKPRIILPK